jgi:hypothetical protein
VKEQAAAMAALIPEPKERLMTKQQNEHGIDRLISLLSIGHSDVIDNITQAGNDRNSISIAFKDGEVLVLTAEDEAGVEAETQNFI